MLHALSCQQKSDQFHGTKVKREPLARVALCNNIIPNQDRALVLSLSSSSSFIDACFIWQTNLLLLLPWTNTPLGVEYNSFIIICSQTRPYHHPFLSTPFLCFSTLPVSASTTGVLSYYCRVLSVWKCTLHLHGFYQRSSSQPSGSNKEL